MGFFKKPFRWAVTYSLILTALAAFVLLDTFVIPRAGVAVSAVQQTAEADVSDETAANVADETETAAAAQTDTDSAQSAASSVAVGTTAVVTDTSYSDANIQITLETEYAYDTAVYIADIRISDVSYLETAFADGVFGRNINETTSSIAEENNALFAVNGDYYGFRNSGYVIRNGVLYRDISGNNEDLVINSEGNFSIISERTTTAQSLLDAGAWQVFSFGPALLNNGEITVTAASETGRSMASNPRTAIGQVSALHYIVIVSDGRTIESAGLSLLELAGLFSARGCTVAYNLDGGGSSTMWFNGQVVNNPTDGRSFGERSVSDIVYLSL